MKYISPKFANFKEITDKDPRYMNTIAKNFGNSDTVVGEITSPENDLVGYLMIDNEDPIDYENPTYYLIIMDDYWSTIQRMFDMPRYLIQNIFTLVGSEFLGIPISYSIES
jgi:hypothetical protein